MSEPRLVRSGSVACALLLASLLAPAATFADDPLTLADANRRWQGARCRSRQAIALKGKAKSDGPTKSEWLWWDERGGNHRARLFFENAGALSSRYRGGWLPPGTDFEAIGWGEDRPGGSAYLEVAVSGLPVRAKLYFYDDWVGQVGVGRLEAFERWVRFDLFEILETPDEALVDVAVPATASAPAPAAPAPVAPATRSPTPSSGPLRAPTLRLLAVSVEPARAAPSDEIRLVATYGVEGLSPGENAEVEERREISRAGEVLTSLTAFVARAAGIHQSSQPLTLPADAAPGVYELSLTLRTRGVEAQGKALFEVGDRAR